MPQFDKDKTIPLLAVIVAGAALGAVGRHIALQQSGDTGTANITFGIVFGGCLLIYFLLQGGKAPAHPVKKKKNLPAKTLHCRLRTLLPLKKRG